MPSAAVMRRFNAHKRLLAAFAIVAACLALLPGSFPDAVRVAMAWDIGVLFFLAFTWWVIEHCPRSEMRQTVLENDQGRVGVLLIVLAAIGASIAAIFFLLEKPKETVGSPPVMHVLLAVLTIVCSWFMTHVMFALHYAHRFYRDDPSTQEKDATGGLAFPRTPAPDYWDFLYFSFVIGMTSQVSDVQVTSHAMRHLVLWHGVLSFAFYTIVLALSINIVAGLL